MWGFEWLEESEELGLPLYVYVYVFFSQATNQASKPVVPASTTELPDTQQGQAAQEDTWIYCNF